MDGVTVTDWMYDTDARSSGVFNPPLMTGDYAQDIPPSVAGTWLNSSFGSQGLLLNVSPDGVAVSFNTFDPAGDPIWFTGLLRTAQERFVAEGPLYSVDGGLFAGTSSATQVPWGNMRIEYIRCGVLRVSWQAIDSSSYPSGDVEMGQLTSMGAYGGCDVESLKKGVSADLTTIMVSPPV